MKEKFDVQDRNAEGLVVVDVTQWWRYFSQKREEHMVTSKGREENIS